jgi:Tol biopolymer transport system component
MRRTRLTTTTLTAAALLANAMLFSSAAQAAAAPCSILQVTYGYTAGGASISDDGGRIAFASKADPVGQNADMNYEIFRYEVATGRTTQVTHTTTGSNGTTAISGDGTRIAFLSSADLTGGNADGNVEVFLYTVGGSFRQVTNGTAHVGIYSLGLDRHGQRLVFEALGDFTSDNPDNDQEIFLFDAAGAGTLAQISDYPGSLDEADHPAISDDGSRIVYIDRISYPNTGPGGSNSLWKDVFQYTVATRRTVNVTDQKRDEFDPYYVTLSGDGAHLAFPTAQDLTSHNGDRNHEIFMKNLSSGATTQLTDTTSEPGTSIGVFSIDDVGGNLVFETSRDVTGHNADLNDEVFLRRPSGAVVQITDTTGLGTGLTSISGNGKRVLFVSSKNITGDNTSGLQQVFLADCSGVPGPKPRPDGLIRLGSAEAFRGGDVYNTTGAGQKRTVDVGRGATVTFSLRIQNDGTSLGSFLVRGGAGDTADFSARYFSGTFDITDYVVAGTYRQTLAAGEQRTIKLRVKVKPGAAAGARLSRAVTITSASDPTIKDVVKAVVRRS